MGDVFLGIGGASILMASLSVGLALKVDPRWAVTAVGLPAAVALALLKFQVYPAVSEVAGTREFVEQAATRIEKACIGDVRRHVAYGIRHYSMDATPPCESEPRRFRIEGDPPRVEAVPGR